VLNSLKKKMYDSEKETMQLEEQMKETAMKKRMEDDIHELERAIKKSELDSVEVEKKALSQEAKLKEIRKENKDIQDEYMFLCEQISCNVNKATFR
jgi:hypothetical protein